MAHMLTCDRCFAIAIDGVERIEIGSAFVDRHCLWNTTLIDRFLKETPGSKLVALGAQQKIDGVGVTVDRAVEIPPFPFDPDVRLVHAPALAGGSFVAAKCLLQYRQQLD
jgi:hypothetical protein